MNPFKICTIVVITLLSSCSWFNDPTSEQKSSLLPLDSFVAIPATGKSLTLGKAESPIVELTPAVQVTFDYDFYFAKTEFTVGEYNQLMKKSLVGDALNPLNNVNWFEAILIANAKSKYENLDTVYSYQELSQGIDGHVTNLKNLKFNYEIDGYRLPTEAEWSLVASWEHSGDYPFDGQLLSASEYGWFNENSENKIHPVNQKKTNSLGIADLAGNLLEWTADWKGQFPDQATLNYIGQLNPNPLSEKVLKGGHFGSSPQPWYNRSDVYTFSVTSVSPYIGFRLARGKILNANYSNKGLSVSENIGSFASSHKEMKDFFLNKKAKLVYVDHTTNALIYAKIDGINSTIQQVDTWGEPVYHPVISPDGNWVAFSTKPEGISGPSSIYLKYLVNTYLGTQLITDNGAIPRWHVDSTGQMSLIYASDAQSNQDYAIWSTKKMFKQKLQFNLDNAILGELEELKVPGTYNGGFSQDLNFWSTGYTKLYNYEMHNSEPELLFTSPLNGKNTDGSSQVCNVSVSPDNNKNILFIDFGYSNKSTITGDSYKIHEYLFSANSKGEIKKWYKAPKGYSNWNFPEWSNNSNIAVSSVVDNQDIPSSIWGINLKDSSYMPLIEGANLWMPYLWIGDSIDNSIPDDSLLSAIEEGIGQYRIPKSNEFLRIAAVKMNRFWNSYDSIEYAVVGSSHAMSIFPGLYQDLHYGINLSWPGKGFNSTKTLLTQYLNRSPNLKLVFLTADFTWWRTDSTRFEENFGKSQGYLLDVKNKFWPQNTDLIQAASNHEMSLISVLPEIFDVYGGIKETWGSSWAEPAMSDENRWEWGDDTSKVVWSKFVNLVDTLTTKGIHVVLVEFPQSPDFKDTEYHGRYGPLKTTWTGVENAIDQLNSQNALFHYIDLNEEGNHSFPGSQALNQDHLNYEGGKVATKILIDSMNIWLP